ncbi:MAG: ABC transporter permease subunit [Acidimicrobiia bacterium]|nr:ABC transporter permease subunit [Acidimicrobiia bacterium]
MVGSIFSKALRDRRLSLIGWATGTVVLTLAVVAVYPLVVASSDLQRFITDFPPEVMDLFGIDPATFLTGAGFLQGQLYTLIGPIMVIGLGATAAAGATAREEKTGTMDMLLSMPVSRTSVMLQKSAVVAVSVLIIPTTMALVMAATNPIFDLELSINGIIAANLGLAGLGLTFAAFALMIAAFSGSAPMTTGITLLVAVLSWFTSAFNGIFEWLEIPSKISPFSWYAEDFPLLGGFPVSFLWLGIGIVALVTAGVTLFAHRDISTEAAVLPRWASFARKRTNVGPRTVALLGSVFAKSVWDHRRSIWAWALGLSALLLLTIAAWPVIASDPDTIQGLVTAMPEELFALLGVTEPGLIATPAGFVSTRAYQSIGPVVMVVFCVGAVTSMIVREERTGILDIVLAHPQRRRRVLVGKVVAITVLASGIGVALMVTGLIGSAIWDMGFTIINVVGANVGLVALSLFFGGLTLALWSLLPSGRSAAGITAGVAVGSFLLNGLGSVVEVLEPFRPLSPFYWYLGDTPPLAHGLSFGYLLLGIGAAACVLVAIRQFNRRDLAV